MSLYQKVKIGFNAFGNFLSAPGFCTEGIYNLVNELYFLRLCGLSLLDSKISYWSAQDFLYCVHCIIITKSTSLPHLILIFDQFWVSEYYKVNKVFNTTISMVDRPIFGFKQTRRYTSDGRNIGICKLNLKQFATHTITR